MLMQDSSFSPITSPDPRAQLSEIQLEAISGGVFERIRASGDSWEQDVEKRWSVSRWVGYSAVAVFSIFAFVVVRYNPGSSTSSVNSAVAPKTYTTTTAQRATITLEEGSRVTLAPETRLEVRGRSVALVGEAIFVVTNHTKKPFTIRTGNATTQVLGTTFSVRSYKDEHRTRVIVANGKVAVNNTVLSAGDVATVTQINTKVLSNADVTALLGWGEGKLYFENVRLSDAATELERWYNVSIRFGDSEIGRSLLEGSFTARTPDELVQTLEFLLKARAERTGRVITLFNR